MSKSKYSKDRKAIVLEKDLLTDITKLKYNLDQESWLDFFGSRYIDETLDCAFLMLDSKRRKMLKVREKISDIVLNHRAVFITLTFTDEVMSKTTPQTRRRYVARYLKSQCDVYVANIDFSPDVGREHYHAVVGSRCDRSAWKYGFSSAEKVRAHNNDTKRLSKYITKLTNHALKVDVTRLIYSRN